MPTFWRRYYSCCLGLRPDDRGRAVSGPARLGPSRRPARPVRRHRAGRRFGSPDCRARPSRRRGRSSAESACGRRPVPTSSSPRRAPTAATPCPSSTSCRSGASARVRRFTLIVYHRGHVAWRSDRLFPGREAPPRLQPARQPRAHGEVAVRNATRRARRFRGRGRPGPHGRCLGAAGGRARAGRRRPAPSLPGPGRWRAGRAVGRHDGGAARHLEAAGRRRDPRR